MNKPTTEVPIFSVSDKNFDSFNKAANYFCEVYNVKGIDKEQKIQKLARDMIASCIKNNIGLEYVVEALDVLNIPNNISYKEKLAWYQLLGDKNE